MADKKFYNVGTIEEDFKAIGLIQESSHIPEIQGAQADSDGYETLYNNPIDPNERKDKKPTAPPSGSMKPAGKYNPPKGGKERSIRGRHESLDINADVLAERLAEIKVKRLAEKVSHTSAKTLPKMKMKMPKTGTSVQDLKPVHKNAGPKKVDASKVGKKLGNSKLESISRLNSEIQETLEAIDDDAKSETVQAFANVALISNNLAEKFSYACKNVEGVSADGRQIDFCGTAKHFGEMAEAAASYAEGLHESLTEGVELDVSTNELHENFAGMMGDLMEGLELFADLDEQLTEGEDVAEVVPCGVCGHDNTEEDPCQCQDGKCENCGDEPCSCSPDEKAHADHEDSETPEEEEAEHAGDEDHDEDDKDSDEDEDSDEDSDEDEDEEHTPEAKKKLFFKLGQLKK